MAQSRTLRVAIVGAGPRGTSVLERLLAHAASGVLAGRELEITLVDPYPAGPGHVWRADQSRLYLMNTQSFYPTLVPDTSVEPGPIAGCSFDRWREVIREEPEGDFSPAERSELASLASTDFPSRALYGTYLRWCFAALTRQLPAGVSVRHLESSVQSLVQQGQEFQLTLDAVTSMTGDSAKITADAVVLALGHIDAQLSPHQLELATVAARRGLAYFPPAVPNDVDWGRIPAGETVLVRGLGLNFFDVLGQLTEGRGGTFTRRGNALSYQPSGKEPRIVAASRRGVPYRAKAALASYYPQSVRLKYLTYQAVAELREDQLPGFEHDLWPLLHRDTLWAYYETLARVTPEALPDGFLAALESALRLDNDWETVINELIRTAVPAEHRLNLRSLARPLAGQHFATQHELDRAVVKYLEKDAAGSAQGEDDPVKMAIGALNAGRAVIKDAVADGGITSAAWLGELRGWFEGFVEGLASGPPALRIEQLAAVVRAGVVSFTGPDPEFGIDEEAGVFTAASPWVEGVPWTSRILVEALAPANRVLTSASPLLNQLLDDGVVRPKIMMAADGVPVATSGLDVTRSPYRPISADGTAVERLYVLGLQLSSVQWGNAIAAQAKSPYPSGYRTLEDANQIAADILTL